LRQATQALDAGQIRAAGQRGAAMTPAAAEYTIFDEIHIATDRKASPVRS
jgi:hypothetical protein